MPRGKKEEEKRERERERERKRGERRRRRKKKAYSLPSLHERSETPGALDRRNWESQEANLLPRTSLSASVRITGYRRSLRIDMCYTEQPKPRLDYWGGKCSEPQSASEHATSTSRQNWVQIQYLSPQPAEMGGACQWTYYHVISLESM